MKVKLDRAGFDAVIGRLQERYRILAPVRVKGKGAFSDTDLVTYGEISSLEDIELNEKTRYSPKEALYPITQTLFYFTEERYDQPEADDKGIIIFLRPCDANAFDRLDHIFLHNGPQVDNYYEAMRSKARFFIIECMQGFSNCSCVSMGTNEYSDYDAFFRFDSGEVSVDVRNEEEFLELLASGAEAEFTPGFIRENEIQVQLPALEQIGEDLEGIFRDSLWTEYDKRCVACGRCNFSCPTCSCFTMQDIFYKDNEKCGERRRVWASCMVEGYTDTAGGHSYRQKNGERMRFKLMHKVYDYRKRFGVPMCVGCGRCDDVCPEYISFAKLINKVSSAVGGGVDEG